MEISSGRIWDYACDQFVHRRIVCFPPSASILDLPERVDMDASLSVHPQSNFEEDIRELDDTMQSQLRFEESKYQEACLQLQILGESRLAAEMRLLDSELEQEELLKLEVRNLEFESEESSKQLREIRSLYTEVEKRVNQLKRRLKEVKDKKIKLEKKIQNDPIERRIQIKQNELERLEIEAQKLREFISE